VRHCYNYMVGVGWRMPVGARGKICACACGKKARDIHSRTICAIYIRG